jgi:HEAT repeat protein
MSRLFRLLVALPTVMAAAAVAFAQPARFEDVVRNLRNPDPKVRISAVRLLREAGYAEAIVPLAPLVNDPINDIQLEALDAELAFYLVEAIPAKRRVALVVEVRTEGRAPAAFDAGPLAAWPKPAPAELVDALLQAVDDDNGKVRTEAIYTLGVVVHGPLSEPQAARLVKALDHYDPTIRAAAARVIGRLQVKSASAGLLKAVNDSNATVRFASIRALGEIQDKGSLQAITEQLNYYEKGEGAYSALDALARIADPSSVPLFQSRLADKDPHIRRAAVEGLARTSDAAPNAALETMANQDESENVRAAVAFALYKKGQRTFLNRLLDFLYSDRTAAQVQGYLLELGPSVVSPAVHRLSEPDEGVRRRLASVFGALGDQSTVTVLTPLKDDRDREVAEAATRAIERIKMTQK